MAGPAEGIAGALQQLSEKRNLGPGDVPAVEALLMSFSVNWLVRDLSWGFPEVEQYVTGLAGVRTLLRDIGNPATAKVLLAQMASWLNGQVGAPAEPDDPGFGE